MSFNGPELQQRVFKLPISVVISLFVTLYIITNGGLLRINGYGNIQGLQREVSKKCQDNIHSKF